MGARLVLAIHAARARAAGRPEEFARLALAAPFDLVAAKQTWLAALADAEAFVRSRPPDEAGCLYWSRARQAFVMPTPGAQPDAGVAVHFGAPGGVVPQLRD